MPKNSLLLILLSISVILNLVSCLNKNAGNSKPTQNKLNEDSLSIDSAGSEENPNILTADSTRFYYMISGLFNDRDSIRKEFPLILKHRWKALTYVVDERKFYLKPVELDTTYWYDECNGIDMLTIQSISENKLEANTEEPNEVQYIYLTGLDRPLGEIPSHFHTQITVNPENPYTFKFNNIQYTLRAEGECTFLCNAITKNYMGRLQNYMDGCNNYKLYLESGGVVQLLNSGTYESTCLEIYFIGDLDGDGKPDFLFETNVWYEGSEVTLFLSSKAQKGELVKNMGPSGNYYSC